MKKVLLEIVDILLCIVEITLLFPVSLIGMVVAVYLGILCIVDRVSYGDWDNYYVEAMLDVLWCIPAIWVAGISRLINGKDDTLYWFICGMFDMMSEDYEEES